MIDYERLKKRGTLAGFGAAICGFIGLLTMESWIGIFFFAMALFISVAGLIMYWLKWRCPYCDSMLKDVPIWESFPDYCYRCGKKLEIK